MSEDTPAGDARPSAQPDPKPAPGSPAPAGEPPKRSPGQSWAPEDFEAWAESKGKTTRRRALEAASASTPSSGRLPALPAPAPGGLSRIPPATKKSERPDPSGIGPFLILLGAMVILIAAGVGFVKRATRKPEPSPSPSLVAVAPVDTESEDGTAPGDPTVAASPAVHVVATPDAPRPTPAATRSTPAVAVPAPTPSPRPPGARAVLAPLHGSDPLVEYVLSLRLRPRLDRLASLEQLPLSGEDGKRVAEERASLGRVQELVKDHASRLHSALVARDAAAIPPLVQQARAAIPPLFVEEPLQRELEDLVASAASLEAPLAAFAEATRDLKVNVPGASRAKIATALLESLATTFEPSEPLRRGCALVAACEGVALPGSLEPARWSDESFDAALEDAALAPPTVLANSGRPPSPDRPTGSPRLARVR